VKTSAMKRCISLVSAFTRMGVFLLKVFPMLPSQPVNWVTWKPLVEKVTYPTTHGYVTGDLYRPSGKRRHAGIVVCLGVVPFGQDHPQVPRLGEALARSGFAALLYWSPVMRDLRMAPDDIDDIALAYEWLTNQPYIDPYCSGLLGTCVGGSFALMASAQPRIRDRVSFVAAYAPFYSMLTLLQDAVSSSTMLSVKREPWKVDQLTRKVLIRSLTASLPSHEAQVLREAFTPPERQPEVSGLSRNALNICELLSHPDPEKAREKINRLPVDLLDNLQAMSPISYLKDIHSPLIVLFHDKGDTVIPVGESRRLWAGLSSHEGVYYKELQFQHLNPAKLPLLRLIRELAKFGMGLYHLFYASENRMTRAKYSMPHCSKPLKNQMPVN
jgi:dienelactone hydrolase